MNQEPLKGGVFVSCGCHNKPSQRGGLKTTKAYSLIVLEARGPKSRCPQGWYLLDVLRENKSRVSLLASVALTVLAVPWLLEASLQCLLLSSHGCPPVSFVSNLSLLSLIRTPVIGFRAHPKSRMIVS